MSPRDPTSKGRAPPPRKTLNGPAIRVSHHPTDDIFDSPTETLDFAVGPCPTGEHVLTRRAADTHGNTANAWLTLTVE
jgi:hypothetical protein